MISFLFLPERVVGVYHWRQRTAIVGVVAISAPWKRCVFVVFYKRQMQAYGGVSLGFEQHIGGCPIATYLHRAVVAREYRRHCAAYIECCTRYT